MVSWQFSCGLHEVKDDRTEESDDKLRKNKKDIVDAKDHSSLVRRGHIRSLGGWRRGSVRSIGLIDRFRRVVYDDCPGIGSIVDAGGGGYQRCEAEVRKIVVVGGIAGGCLILLWGKVRAFRRDFGILIFALEHKRGSRGVSRMQWGISFRRGYFGVGRQVLDRFERVAVV